MELRAAGQGNCQGWVLLAMMWGGGPREGLQRLKQFLSTLLPASQPPREGVQWEGVGRSLSEPDPGPRGCREGSEEEGHLIGWMLCEPRFRHGDM